jgi:hypothetical protein
VGSEGHKRLALLSGSLLLGLFLVESVVRLIEPREVLREFFVTRDPVLHHRFIPGARGRQKTLEFDAAYAINSLGLRDEEMPLEEPFGTRRILMLGDSFTEGIGVDEKDVFSTRLQAMLDDAHLGERWRVVNAGLGSYSPLLEYLYLKNGGLDLHPDLVILNFDLSDIYDDIQYTKLAVFDGKGDPVAVRPEPPREKGAWPAEALIAVKDFVKEHTRIYNFLRRRIDVGGLRKEGDFSGNVRLDKYAMLREDVGPRDDRDWTLSYGYLIKIRDMLWARGIDFWVTVYPYGLQVSPREWGEGRLFWGFQKGRVYSTRPQRLVERFCINNDIPVINMCDEFKGISQTVYPLYYEYDGHWRPAAHEVAAEILCRSLIPYLQSHEAPGRHDSTPQIGVRDDSGPSY